MSFSLRSVDSFYIMATLGLCITSDSLDRHIYARIG